MENAQIKESMLDNVAQFSQLIDKCLFMRPKYVIFDVLIILAVVCRPLFFGC